MYQKNPAVRKERKNAKNEAVEWIRALSIAVVAAILIRAFLFEVVQVEQSSMYPTLKEGDRLGVVKCAYWFDSPSRGDIVIARVGEQKYYVKRVAAVGGERVRITDSTLYINDVPTAENYLVADLVYPNFDEVAVPEGFVFLMGDNRAGSIDSRDASVGFVEEKDIISKTAFRFVPFRWFW